MMMRGESLSDTDNDWPRLGQLVLVYGGSQWYSDWFPGVKIPKQINNNNIDGYAETYSLPPRGVQR